MLRHPVATSDEELAKPPGEYDEVERLRRDVERLRQRAEVQRLLQETLRLKREETHLAESFESAEKVRAQQREAERLRQDVERLHLEAEIEHLQQERLQLESERLEREKPPSTKSLESAREAGGPYGEFGGERPKEDRDFVGKPYIETLAHSQATEKLVGRIEQLEKERDRLRNQIWKDRKRPSLIASCGLAGIGALSLVSSVVLTSTVLAFIGLGLAFWGALLLFIRPGRYVPVDVMDSTALSSFATIDRVITSLGYTQKGVYMPAGNPEKTVVFIPFEPLRKLPKIELAEKQTFVKDPEGIAMIPPGLALANLFERELGVEFTEWNLKQMSERLPRLLIEDLELVQDCTIDINGDDVTFRFVESVYSEFCGKLRDSMKVCSSLGCPMCSAMACVLAQVSHRPVQFDEDKYSTDGTTVESSYHILAG